MMKKIIRLFIIIIGCLIVAPLVILIRIVRPFVCFRFGAIRTDVIGHFIFNVQYYLSCADFKKPKTIDCFYFSTLEVPNKQWSKMVQRNLLVNYIFYFFDIVNNFIPWGESHKMSLMHFEDLSGILFDSDSQIKFTNDENAKGFEFLREFGVNDQCNFVCLLVRDSAYKKKYQSSRGNNWNSHNFRDSDIDNYDEAALFLANKGYLVFRMGKAVNKKFNVNHQNIIDYANMDFRSDFLDIWLMANCTFCISTGTGTDMVAQIYKKPMLIVNYLTLYNLTAFNNVTYVPKYLKWKNNNSFLSLSEQIYYKCSTVDDFKDKGIEVIDLSREEILEAVKEVFNYVNGESVLSNENIELQSLFWSQFLKRFENNDIQKYQWIHPEASIGSSFIKKNQSWLLNSNTSNNKNI